MKRFNADAMGEKLLRRLAGGSSRRSMLSRLGAALVAAPVFPLLPVSRAEAAKPDRSPEAKTGFARNAQTKVGCIVARPVPSRRPCPGSAPASTRTMARPI